MPRSQRLRGWLKDWGCAILQGQIDPRPHTLDHESGFLIVGTIQRIKTLAHVWITNRADKALICLVFHLFLDELRANEARSVGQYDRPSTGTRFQDVVGAVCFG